MDLTGIMVTMVHHRHHPCRAATAPVKVAVTAQAVTAQAVPVVLSEMVILKYLRSVNSRFYKLLFSFSLDLFSEKRSSIVDASTTTATHNTII